MTQSNKDNSWTSISDLISAELGRVAGDNVQKNREINHLWKNTVGPGISQNSRVLFLRENTLHIGVENSTWLFELGLIKKRLIANLNKQIPGEETAIEDIKFKVST